MEEETQFSHCYQKDLSGRQGYHYGYWIKIMHPGRRGRRSAIPYFIFFDAPEFDPQLSTSIVHLRGSWPNISYFPLF